MRGRTAAGSILAACALSCLLATAARGAVELPASITGFVEAEPIAYAESGNPDGILWLRSHLAWERRLSDHFLVRASGDLALDSHGEVDRAAIHDPTDRGLRQAPLRIEELSITWSVKRFDLAVGKMIIPWGRADLFNPTDNLTPFDTTDPLERARLSSWAIRALAEKGRMTVEGDILPFPGVTRLPPGGSRWLPLPERGPNPFGPGQVALEWRDGETSYPPLRVENVAWAAKVDYRGPLIEGSLSHYDGWDDQPVLVPRILFASTTPRTLALALDRVQPELRSTGADVAVIRGRLALRGEAAIDSRGDPANRRFTFYALEGEWTAGNWRLIGGWAEILGVAAAETTASTFDQGALPAAIVHIERSVPTGTGASIQIIRSLEGDGMLLRAEATFPIGQSLRLSAGVDAIDGPEGTFLGAYRHNDRATLRLRWSFAARAASIATY